MDEILKEGAAVEAAPPPPTCPGCQYVFNNEYPECANCRHCTYCCICRECAQGHATTSGLCDCCNCCPDHCGCESCARCHNRCESTCSRCSRCANCCPCVTCSCCDALVHPSNFCHDCNCCGDCCECGSEEDCSVVAFVERELHWLAAGKLELKRNPSKRFISCEIEVANASDGMAISTACAAWHCSVVKDGSLPDTGFEINTSPASGDVFLRQIEDLCRALADGGAIVTTACGLHVHLDARDLRYWDIRRLVLLYAKVEAGLFQLVPPSRRSNDCCRSCGAEYAAIMREGRPGEIKDRLLRRLYGRTSNTRYSKHDKYCSCRYTALNLHSWLYRGSVEFRLGAGTTDCTKITQWSMLLAAIVDYAAKQPDKVIDGLSGVPLDLLKRLAPTEAVRTWIDTRYTQLN